MSSQELQGAVQEHDKLGWKQEPGLDSRRHNILHVAKTAGRLVGQIEEIEDGLSPVDTPIVKEFIADLAIEALRGANLEGYDLDVIVQERLAELRERNTAR